MKRRARAYGDAGQTGFNLLSLGLSISTLYIVIQIAMGLQSASESVESLKKNPLKIFGA